MKWINTTLLVGALTLAGATAMAQTQQQTRQPAAHAAEATDSQPGTGQLVAPGIVTGVTGHGHVVTDLDKSIEFYRDTLGLKILSTSGRAQTNSDMQRLTNTPGAKFRSATVEIPNAVFTMQLLEFTGLDRKPAPGTEKITPGITNLTVGIKDLNARFPKIQQTPGVRVLAKDGIKTEPGRYTVFITDIDGYTIQLNETLPIGKPPGYVPQISLTTQSAEGAGAFFHDVLGFPRRTVPWGRVRDSFGLPDPGTGEVTQTTGSVPGTRTLLVSMEYRGLPAVTPFRPRIQDPAASFLTLRVRDMDEVVKIVQTTRTPIVTRGGAPLKVGNTRRIVIQNPDGVFIELVEGK